MIPIAIEIKPHHNYLFSIGTRYRPSYDNKEGIINRIVTAMDKIGSVDSDVRFTVQVTGEGDLTRGCGVSLIEQGKRYVIFQILESVEDTYYELPGELERIRDETADYFKSLISTKKATMAELIILRDCSVNWIVSET